MTNSSKKNRGLGRGLSALMADIETPDSAPQDSTASDVLVPIENVHPNPDQPRRTFDSDDLEQLALSITEKGIIQPLIVRELEGQIGQYQIVAGERRWRAAQRAKLHQVPVIVRQFTNVEVLEVAIIENIQRSDLNPVDEAMGYKQLMEKFGHTQEKLAESLSKSRSHIANSLRLLKLPEGVLTFLEEGKISAGHARALITADEPTALAKRIVAGDLSVREAEKLAKSKGKASAKQSTQPNVEKDADTLAIERELSATLKMNVKIDHNANSNGGKITLSYKSLEQLDDFLQAMGSL